MRYLANEKGYALLTVFLLGTISIILVGIVFFLLGVSGSMSGMDKSYTSELEVAKGIGGYTMTASKAGSLSCTGGNCTVPGAVINVPVNVCTAMGKAD